MWVLGGLGTAGQRWTNLKLINFSMDRRSNRREAWHPFSAGGVPSACVQSVSAWIWVAGG